MPRPRILVVDDVAANRFLLEESLAELDADVVSAESGHQALEVAAAEWPDVALVDFQMPDLDGGETARRLKAHEGAPFVYVILMSGYREAEDEVPAKLHGAVDHFLPKPYTLADLRDAVAEGLRVTRERRTS